MLRRGSRVIFCLFALLMNAERSVSSDDFDLDQLMQTDISTKTEAVNFDFSPGLITILDPKKLAQKGMRTVAEALELVPGWTMPIDNNGIYQPVVRGVGGILSGTSGKIKVLLNGVPVNATLSAIGDAVYDIPIEQIKKIEVLRGPGSSLHGEYAYLGVVNVVTRQSGNNAHVYYGSFDTVGAGLVLSNHCAEDNIDCTTTMSVKNDLKVSLNLSGWQSKGDEIVTGTDILFGSLSAFNQPNISLSPGKTNEAREDKKAIFNLSYKGFSLLMQYSDAGTGDYFGFTNALAPEDNHIVRRNIWRMVELGQLFNPNDDLTVNFKLGWQDLENKIKDAVIFPPAWFFGLFPEGQISSNFYEESRYYGMGQLTWKAWDKQTWLFSLEYHKIQMGDVFFIANFDPLNPLIPGTPFGAPLPNFQRFSGSHGNLEEDKVRHISSVVLQDQIRINDELNLTIGSRYDHYSDVGDNISPRLALVYQFAYYQLFKLQYAHAFRPPSFVQLYSATSVALGNPKIEPETIKTLEVAYIYKAPTRLFRLTLFRSNLDNLIIAQNQTFENSSGAYAKGIELEWEYKWSEHLSFDSNLSYVSTRGEANKEDLLASSDILANLGMLYSPYPDYSLGVYYHYVGSRNRALNDGRGNLEAYHTLDLTANMFNLFSVNALTLRFGVKNLFDDNIVYPAPANTYVDDYPRQERSYWLQFSKQFN